MARRGQKEIIIKLKRIEDMEFVSDFLKRRNKGLKYRIEYTHDIGMKIILYGPNDKIKLLEYELLHALNN